MKKYINATLITTALITTALIATHTTHPMLSRRALPTALRNFTTTLPVSTASRAILATPKQTVMRTMAYNTTTNTTKKKLADTVKLIPKIKKPRTLKAPVGNIDCSSLASDKAAINTIISLLPTTDENEDCALKRLRSAQSDLSITKENFDSIARTYNSYKIKRLLTSPSGVNAVDEDNNSALMIASKHGLTRVVEALLIQGASVRHANNCDNTALQIAAKAGNTAIVEILLKCGASIDHDNNYEHTALLYAAKAGSPATVKILLEHKASVDKATRYGRSPLLMAIRYKYADIAKMLLDAQADVQHLDKFDMEQLQEMLPEMKFE